MATTIEKNTAKLMIDRYQKELEALYNEQEAYKMEHGLNDDGTKKCYGGRTRRKKLQKGGKLTGEEVLIGGHGRGPMYTMVDGFIDTIYGNPPGWLTGNAYLPMEPVDSKTLAKSYRSPGVVKSPKATLKMSGGGLVGNWAASGAGNLTPDYSALDLTELNPTLAGGKRTPGNVVDWQKNNIGPLENFWGNLNSGKYDNFINSIGSLAPTIYSFAKSFEPAEELPIRDARDFMNPYTDEALNLLSDPYRYNAQPEIDQYVGATNAAIRNASSAGASNTGALYNRMLAARMAGSRGIAGSLANKQNIEGQMNQQRKARAAQMLAGIGAQDASMAYNVAMGNEGTALYNMQSRARQDDYMQTALSDLSNYIQMKERQGNLSERDLLLKKLWMETFPVSQYMDVNLD